MRDDQGRGLIEHGSIRLIELSKFHVEQVETEAERWLKFLREGERLDPGRLPEWMRHPIMRQAMSTLNGFSEKERDYHRYQSRQEALRQQRAIQHALEEARQAIETERQAKEAERQAKEAERQAKEAERQAREVERQAKESALAEVARLKALLKQQDSH